MCLVIIIRLMAIVIKHHFLLIVTSCSDDLPAHVARHVCNYIPCHLFHHMITEILAEL